MKSKLLGTVFIALAALVGIFILGTFSSIYFSVARSCTQAKNTYGTDCVNAMIKTIEASDVPVEDKNHAIWVLGQLADKRALPTLKRLATQVPDHKEPLDQALSQYEISKAIKWCEEGNSTSFMYRSIR